MRRKTLVLVLAFGAASAFASSALAGSGGFAPETPGSPNTERINDVYVWISIFAAAILVLVEGSLLWFIFRYRRRGRARTVEGPQIHGATRLELIWTAVPVVILAVILGFIFYKLPGIKNVPAARAEGGPLKIRVDAHQFYWQFTYPNGAVSIDELRAPVNRTVEVEIDSHDVVHSWWVPELHGKFDAIPGERNETWFRAERVGTYKGKCGEFCGVFHAQMNARVRIVSRAEYERWLAGPAREELGRSEWEGACAKCHGLDGEGGFGPLVSNNSLLLQRNALERLVRNGQGRMPPIARGWTDEQLRALAEYLRSDIYEEQQDGG